MYLTVEPTSKETTSQTKHFERLRNLSKISYFYLTNYKRQLDLFCFLSIQLDSIQNCLFDIDLTAEIILSSVEARVIFYSTLFHFLLYCYLATHEQLGIGVQHKQPSKDNCIPCQIVSKTAYLHFSHRKVAVTSKK